MSVLPVGAATGALWPSADTVQSGGQVGAAQGGLTEGTAPTTPTAPLGTSGQTSAVGNSFANLLGNAMDSVQATQTSADNLATQAATGSLTNVADYMVTADEADIQTQLTAAVRNSALQAFQQIMGMQL
ncbi:MAG TPA: flagellar hook-basal body complex protein FliE [Acidimicrobiales bacterium]|nr:flagellar hook-basal body complex protein FliE [Acidimicrobiales bacterium]